MRRPGCRTAVGATPLDIVIYNAGIWESSAFRPGYSFDRGAGCGDGEHHRRSI